MNKTQTRKILDNKLKRNETLLVNVIMDYVEQLEFVEKYNKAVQQIKQGKKRYHVPDISNYVIDNKMFTHVVCLQCGEFKFESRCHCFDNIQIDDSIPSLDS